MDSMVSHSSRENSALIRVSGSSVPAGVWRALRKTNANIALGKAVAETTPAIVTAVLTGVYSAYAIVRFVQSGRLNGALTLIFALFLSLVVVVNLQIMHRLVRRLAFLKDLSAPCSCSTE